MAVATPARPRGGVLVGLLAVLLAADELTPPSVRFGPLMVAAPALAAVLCGPGYVLAVLGVTLGCVVAAAQANLQLDVINFPVQLATTAVIGAAAVWAAALRQHRERQLAQVRWVAEVAQRLLLRPIPRRLGPLTVASVYLAADEEAEIGGDVYAATDLGGAARFLIGDVSVHHQDVLRGLGRIRTIPPEVAAAIFREGVLLSTGTKRNLLRYRVEPTTVGGRSLGRGRVVRGATEALGLWLAGRRGLEDELEFAP